MLWPLLYLYLSSLDQIDEGETESGRQKEFNFRSMPVAHSVATIKITIPRDWHGGCATAATAAAGQKLVDY